MGGSCEVRKKGIRAVKIAFFITLIFMLTQLIGGWIANSLALMADAAHMAIDAASFLLTLFAFWIAKRPATPKMSYGYYRAEILGAAASALALWVICFFLIFEAIRRLGEPHPVDGGLVFIIACITLAFNLITMKVLHGSSKDSLNVKAAYIHVLSDLLGNIGVILSGGIIWLTGWDIVDPILTLLFTVLILFSSGRMLREALEILMEATPKKLDTEKVAQTLLDIPAVEDLHDLHVWTLSSGRTALSCHLISPESQSTLTEAHARLKKNFNILHTTIQVEHPNTFDPKECFDTDWGQA